MAKILRALGRDGEATASFREGVERITPFLLAYPAGFAGLARALASDYVEVCEADGGEPDVELLRPVAEVLEALDGEGS